MASAPSILDQVYFCNTHKGFKLGDGVTPVDDLPVIHGGGIQGPPGKDGLQGPAGVVLDPDDPRVLQHNQQVGEIITFYGDSAPEGTLLCDGATVELADYPHLGEFLIQQNPALDAGDGVHFTLPDMRNMFLRGVGGTREVGSRQGDALQQIYGQILSRPYNNAPTVNGTILNATGVFTHARRASTNADIGGITAAGANRYDITTFDASRVARTDIETRPMNIAVSFAIRYESSVLCSVKPSGGESFALPPNDGHTYSMCNGQWVPNALLSDD